jgi:predicted esterase
MGYQWFGISRLDPAVAAAGVRSAAPFVESFLDDTMAQYGLDESKTVLVGFSQGGALTLYTALRAPGAPFAAAAVLSGYMPLPGQIAPSPAVLAETPLLLCHGDRDAVVPLAYGRDAAERARALGVAALTFKTYAGMGHGAGDEELRDLIAFLRKHLPPLPAAGGGGGGGAAEGVE